MTDLIVPSDPVVVHSQFPTHPRKPVPVLEAEAAAREAWEQHAQACDDYEAGRVELSTVLLAEQLAAAREQVALELRAGLLAGHTPAQMARDACHTWLVIANANPALAEIQAGV